MQYSHFHALISVSVVVQFYPWFKFYFPLFLFMLSYYDNEYETKENKNWTKDKIELQHIFNQLPHLCTFTYIWKLWQGVKTSCTGTCNSSWQ